MDQGFQIKEIKLRTEHSQHRPPKLNPSDGREPEIEENTKNSQQVIQELRVS